MALEILGVGHSDGALYFYTGADEFYVLPTELDDLRQRAEQAGEVEFYGATLDESDVTELIRQFNMAQPPYPLEACGSCGDDAVAKIEGEFFCQGHELGYRRREDEAS